jgi:eukaryotic-like serine/threonine-protein kinase
MAACTVCGRLHAADRPCPERAETSRTGQIVGGKYEVVRHIGEGGMASVYEARHVEIQRPFALKFLHPWLCADDEWLERFRREAGAGGALISEHITAIVDIGITPDETPYIVMEFLTGEDLGQRLARENSLKPADAIEIVIQACCGLGVAHAAGVVHRDLKPENLFLCDRQLGGSVVKILDFGIAKLRNAQAQVTRAGMVIGTPFYMSPEQAAGRGDVDHRSDIYALGVILYELLSGEKPFVGENHSVVLGQIINSATPALQDELPTVSAELALVVQRAMAKSPRDRFQTAAEFAEALYAFSPQARRSSRTANSFGSKALWRALSAPSMTVAEPNLTVRLNGSRGRVSSPGPIPKLSLTAPNLAIQAGADALDVAEERSTLNDAELDDQTSVDVFGADAADGDEVRKPRVRSMVGSYPAPPDPSARADRISVPRMPPKVSLSRALLPVLAGVIVIVALIVSFNPGRGDVDGASAAAQVTEPARSPAQAIETEPKPATDNVASALAPTAESEPSSDPEVTSTLPSGSTSEPVEDGEAPPGLLNVNSEPSAELFIGGKSRGRTPIVGLRMPPGEYQLVLVDPGRNRRIKTVRIQSRQRTAVSVHFGDLSQAIGSTSAAPSSAPPPTAAPSGKTCATRFYIDTDGVKRVKPECLF